MFFLLTSCTSSLYLSLSSHENITQIFFLWISVWGQLFCTIAWCTLRSSSEEQKNQQKASREVAVGEGLIGYSHDSY